MKKFNYNIVITLFTIGIFSAVFIMYVFKSSPVPEKMAEENESAEFEENETTSGAMESMDLWAKQRAYPERTIPDEKYYKAFEYSKLNLSSASERSVSDWKKIGPFNIGGRTLSLAFNPMNGNTIYAGSASGGLWRSYSGGIGESAWEYIKTGFPVLSVGTVAIADNDSNTMYIGTGEVYGYQNSIGGLTLRTTRGSYGIGILKTTNGGINWSKSLDWSLNQKRGVEVIRINPKNPNTVWAGTTEGTYRSFNAGATWTQVDNTIMVTDIAINPVDTGTVFIACGNLGTAGTGIYRTQNSGASWTMLQNGLPPFYGGKAIFSIYKTSPNVIFASIGEGAENASRTWLVKSVNNGDNWTTVSTENYATYQGWYSHIVGVNPVDSSKVITAGIDIFKSTTGGTNLVHKTNWAAWYLGRVHAGDPEGPPNFSHADHHTIAYNPANPDIIYFGNDGGVFRTTDGGETFAGCNGGYQTTQFYNGFSTAVTDSNYSMGGLQDNATAIFDGQTDWIRVIGGDGCWTGINYRNKDTLYGSYQYLSVLRSINGGNSFSNLNLSSASSPGFTAPYILARNNPQLMYAAGTNVLKSTNGGTSWSTINGNNPLDGINPALCMASSPINDNLVYATTAPVISSGKMFVTSDGGNIWRNITGSLPNRYLVDIAVDPIAEGTVYVTASGYGSGHIFKSIDYGQFWTDITGNLPDVPTSSILIDPLNNNIIYAGNDIGVYVSTNGGASWEVFMTGLPDASIVMDLGYSPLNRKIRAATHGNGVFERDMLSPGVNITQNQSHLKDFRLYQNYPNPFNPVTSIRFDIPKRESIKIKVYNIEGKETARLANNVYDAGTHEVVWDATGFSSGVYLYKIESDDFFDFKKMTLVK